MCGISCILCLFPSKRDSQVAREKKFVQSDVPRKLVHGITVLIWQTIIQDASCALTRAVCNRRQFGSDNGRPDIQGSRLFPLLASAYAFKFFVEWLYTDVTQKLQANDFSTLPKAQACTAGLKSLLHGAALCSLETCFRHCCK
ncbi:hypothetical protein ACH5RR_025820 [Cinchona calisaya]|uniref:Acyl-CoA oxidase C-alpha1 domain-containing protein n=1 Tax=Cinchona calisaya TaxID=153742 RepID=A0ABD2Z0R1_9GENT